MSPGEAASSLLARLTREAPEGIWSAPGRVNLIGEHTDYNEGFVLPLAIQHRTFVAVSHRRDARLRVASTLDPASPVEIAIADLGAAFPASRERIPEWARYPLGVAWALRHTAGPSDPAGLDLAIASDLPVGAGLSSSAALESATALALDELWRLGLDRLSLAKAGRRAENEVVGAPTGIMDQVASLFGQADAAVFLDGRALTTELVALGFADAGLELLVIDTGVVHAHATGGYGERRAACERAAGILNIRSLRDLHTRDLEQARARLDATTFRRVRHVVTENERVLDAVRHLRRGEARSLGALLTASHRSLRDDFEVSIPELDLAVRAAGAAGALGARLTGGGFGGAAIALVDHALVPAVTAQIGAAFAEAGFRAPVIGAVRPSEGARRDR